MMIETLFWVMLAGAVASVLRYLSSIYVRPSGAGIWAQFPWGIALVNIIGSFIAGWATGLAFGQIMPADVYAVVILGFCGGLTTMSTFAVDTMQLVKEGRLLAAAVNVAGTTTLAFLALSLGFAWSSGAFA